MNPNKAILDQQFLEPVAVVAGIKLQPISPGFLTAVRKLKLTLIIGTAEEKEKLDNVERQFQLMATLLLLASPRDEVKHLVNMDESLFREKVEDFEFSLPVSAMGEAAAALVKVTEQANVAAVEVLPKPPGNANTEAAPPPNS